MTPVFKKLFFIILCVTIDGSEIPNFKDLSQTKGSVFFLSTTRSGSNLISGSLGAITRKPIAWLYWKDKVFKASTARYYRNQISYNRLNLPLVTDIPLLYRTHVEFDELRQIPSYQNKLIFVTRNPRELLLRAFFLTSPTPTLPDKEFIAEFLKSYITPFEVYDSWAIENRCLVFYEDFIEKDEEILLDILKFIDERPLYFEDFIENKGEYMSRLLDSYREQHVKMAGGSSAANGPQPLFYSNKASQETLEYLDQSIEEASPEIWEKYLKRFAW